MPAGSTPAPAPTTNTFKEARRQQSQTRGMRVMKMDADTQTDTPPSPEQITEKCCSICLDARDHATDPKNTTITGCGHLFCTSCLLKHLAIRNTCPNCRAEIEPARAPAIEPLTAVTVATIIRDEETSIDMTRRIAVIGAFPDNDGRAAMILSLARELAFGSAHSMAGWQGTDETTYHESWTQFEYSQPEDDEDDEDDDDDDDEDDEDDEDEVEDDDDDDNRAQCVTQVEDEKEENEVYEGNEAEMIVAVSVSPQRVALTQRAAFQSPRFSTFPLIPVHPAPPPAFVYHNPYEISGFWLFIRFAIFVLSLYVHTL